jgi:hypothetical protein
MHGPRRRLNIYETFTQKEGLKRILFVKSVFMEAKAVVYILTHGRANNVRTFKSLQDAGWKGDTFFIVDDEDKELPIYRRKYGTDKVLVFNKQKYFEQTDKGNPFGSRSGIVFARNACYDIARERGHRYFIQLDDDYTSFYFRFENEEGTKLLGRIIKDFDRALQTYLTFLKNTPFKTIAFAQGGDFIGGIDNPYAKKRPLLRKAMNSFICDTEKPMNFVGILNEDVNMYVLEGSRGELFGTSPMIQLTQQATQSNKGGISYSGTYLKSFTSVLMHPSSVKVAMMHSKHVRIHHLIDWKKSVPVIIEEKWKK